MSMQSTVHQNGEHKTIQYNSMVIGFYHRAYHNSKYKSYNSKGGKVLVRWRESRLLKKRKASSDKKREGVGTK